MADGEQGDRLLDLRIENENMLLACALIDPNGVRQQLGWVAPEMFHQEAQGKLWRRFKDGMNVLDAALEERLSAKLMSWTANLPSAVYAEFHAKQVARGHYMAQSRQAAIDHVAATMRADYEAARATAQKWAAVQPVVKRRVRDMGDAAASLITALEAGEIAIQTGITKLDTKLGGLERRKQFVLAGRPSTGKTALALHIAQNVAAAGKRVLYVSYEMSEGALLARMACPVAGVSWPEVRSGALPRQRVQHLLNVASEIGMGLAATFHIDDGRPTADAIWEMAVAVQADLVVVDHLGIAPKADPKNDVESLGLLTMAYRDMAKQLNLASLVLCQMGRDIERRANPEPRMSDLYGSSRIEQNADIVAFLHSNEPTDTDAPPRRLEDLPNIRKVDMLIAKDRDGVRDAYIPLDFHLREQKFVGRGEALHLARRDKADF